MELIFEIGKTGRGTSILPECDVEEYDLSKEFIRESDPNLPQVSEVDISRHYSKLAKRVYGINNGIYPLGSCTMKYNPRINEETAALPGFTQIHPLQEEHSIQGCLEVLSLSEKYLCEITGMDAMTFQPAAGAHGEFTGLLMIKEFHNHNGEYNRNEIIIPDSAHGTNPASAAMAGFTVINIRSNEKGCIDLDELKKAVNERTAGLMLTNPNTVGIFDENILEITEIIHKAGGINYYDGANLNAIAGIVRPGDMGFDIIHLNLHKTFATPHGGGGPGAGPVGCKKELASFLPNPVIKEINGAFTFENSKSSIGRVKVFNGHFLVILKALSYILTLGKDGIKGMSENAVLNANYLKKKLENTYDIAYEGTCMHEFVITLESLKKAKGVSALDIAKAILNKKIHPPTMYFPLIVHEALMVEPTETESKDTLDETAEILIDIYNEAIKNPQLIKEMPINTDVRRIDEVNAARNPILKYDFK